MWWTLSSWSLERENARNYETKTSSSYFDVELFPCCLVRGWLSAPVDRRLHDRNSSTLHTNLAQPPSSVQLWVSKLSKSCQHFLNLLVKEKQLWQVNVLSPRMPSYGTLSLFRTSFAGCYAFPCISLGCDVSTCKPYERKQNFHFRPCARFQNPSRSWDRGAVGRGADLRFLTTKPVKCSSQWCEIVSNSPRRVKLFHRSSLVRCWYSPSWDQ